MNFFQYGIFFLATFVLWAGNTELEGDIDPFLAVREGNLAVLKEFFANKPKDIDINTPNIQGETLLHEASYGDDIEIMRFLIEKGADVNKRDNGGNVPLHSLIHRGFYSGASLLLKAGANPNMANFNNRSIICCAYENNNQWMLELLKNSGVNFDPIPSIQEAQELQREWQEENV